MSEVVLARKEANPVCVADNLLALLKEPIALVLLLSFALGRKLEGRVGAAVVDIVRIRKGTA
jgi:hypothetical protein